MLTDVDSAGRCCIFLEFLERVSVASVSSNIPFLDHKDML